MTLNCPLQHFSAAEDERKRQKEQKGGWGGDVEGVGQRHRGSHVKLHYAWVHTNMDTQTLQFCVYDF